MAKFISKKEEKYNADDIANQLISQINNNEVDSSKIKTEEINIRSDKNDYNENNNVSLWDKVKNIANGFGKNIQNAGLGIDNGISYFRQQLERNTRNNTFNNAVNINNVFLQEQLEKKSKNKSNYGIGNIDLNNRPIYQNEDGSISTVRSMSFWDDNENKEILVPTIAFDEKGNAISLTNDEAIQRYYQTGEYLGKFDDYKDADKYAEKLHRQQDKLYNNTNYEKAKSLLEENNKYVDKIKNEQNDYQNKLQEKINNNNQKISKNIEDINNPILKKTAQLAPSIGQMIPSFIPGFGAVYASGSASGQYYEDAKQRGMNDEEAQKYSGIMGLMEGASEMIGIENLSKAGKGVKALVKGTGKEIVKEGTKELTKSSMKTVLKNYGIGIADNIIQEAIIDPIQELTAQTVAGKDKAEWEGIGQKMLQDGINGGLVSAILGGANLGIQSCTGVVEKLHSNQKITGQEIQNAVKEAGQQLDTSKMMLDSVEQQVNKYKDYYTGKELDNNTQNILNEAQKIIAKERTAPMNKNEGSNQEINQFQPPMQQTIQQDTKMAQNQNTEQINDVIEKVNKSTLSNEEKTQMIDFLRQNPDENSIRDIEKVASENQRNILKEADFKKDDYRRKTYTQKRNEYNKNSNYDNEIVNMIKESTPANRNGKYTASQYKTMAENIGKQLAIEGKTESQVEDIAFKSYLDEEPTKNLAKYNSKAEGRAKFERIFSDDWVNAVYKGYNNQISKQTNNNISVDSNIQNGISNQIKQQQLDIINNSNPMTDDYHTGIRNIDDIKTFEEAIQDDESFVYGDYSKEDAQRDLQNGTVTIYSSKPIENGAFVSTSQNMVKDYAGNGQIYSKEVPINEVAWINGDEGQYANINKKYAVPTKDWQQFVEDNYQKQGTGKNLKEYNLPTKESTKTELNLPTKENINTQGETINWNEIERPEGKIRKHYKSIIESSNTTKEAKSIAKELMGTDTYVPETNKSQLAQADARINNSSPESELKSLMNRATTGGKIEAVDIAVGERLIQYYSKVGDKTNLQEAIQATAMAGTNAGQTVQALSMLNHQTPEGQATWIQRSVDKMNNELAKKKGGTITKDSEGNIKVINKLGKDITDKVDLFELTPDMIDKIVSSKNKTEMYDNIDQVYEDLGQQVPLSTMEKIDSWRYFSMLANPKTHIRNMVGNVAMGKTQSLKDKLAGGIEDIVGTFNKDMERTKTLRPADAKTKEFAKNDVLNPDVQSMMELNENKYNPQSRLQNARKTFKNDALENTLGRLFNWNDKLLEAEDALGLKSAYKKALTDYLTANKIDVDNITDKQLSKARNYAVEQAKEATFHQANSLATWINQASTNNKIVKGAKDAILPFVKTPLNVAKTGIEYNPVGLLKTITYDTVKLRKGDITVNKYIDNLSKGLTGTGIAVLGYALADAGILKASGGDDDKKEKYDEALGKQTYSITIGERTYSLDWLSPVGIPLFVGAEANALRNSQQKEKNRISSDDDKKYNQTLKSLENLANAMSNSMSPMSEMSMISGLTSALSSYEKDKTSAVITNAVKSYVNQFVPTVLGQIARTTDDYERSTTSTKSSGLSKAIDQTKLQLMSKIPGLRQKLPTKEDIWGNEQKAEPNIPLRVVNNFVNPSTVKNINTSKVDEELDNLYNKTGESTILPSTIEKTYTINGQTYRMTNEEYSKYKKNYGQTSYKLLDDLINSNDYNKLSDEQKQKAIENIYSYAKEVNKVDYAKNNNETVKTSTLYDTLEELKQKGGNQSSYLNYIAKTKDITGEDSSKKKIEVLANSNYTDKTKEIIYKNTEGSKDKKIIVVDKLGLPINEYLKYKSQKFESDKDEDGETISGSKKQKVYNYLNSISDEELSQDYKKIICKIEDINTYDNDIVNFVNSSKNLNYSERTEILKDIGFKIDKDGKIQTKSMIPIYKYVK